MAIPSIWRLISYSSNTKFLLVNFAIVKKKKLHKGGEHRGAAGEFEDIRPLFYGLNCAASTSLENNRLINSIAAGFLHQG